jgi:hypothetical protein
MTCFVLSEKNMNIFFKSKTAFYIANKPVLLVFFRRSNAGLVSYVMRWT